MRLSAEDVTAVIPTRGNVDLGEILRSLIFPARIVWDNSQRRDAGIYGRYLAAAHVDTPFVYFQDDDVIVPPDAQRALLAEAQPDVLTSNMPDGYHDATFPGLTWVGWGAICGRTLPAAAFRKWRRAGQSTRPHPFRLFGCDIVASMLSRTRTLDLGRRDLDYATGNDRLYAQPGFKTTKRDYYDLAREIACA